MDKRVIQKIIEHSGESCPGFKYENPLLDKNIANLLSKGFIKLLKNQDKSNHRLLLLENIRKSCKVEPPGHLHIDDNVTEVLQNAYQELLGDSDITKDLDSFLIRTLKEINISPLHPPTLKPDIMQALINLNGGKQEIPNILFKDIIHWNINDNKQNGYLDILESMWNMECVNKFSTPQLDDISIKMKPLIENILLSCALEMLNIIIVDDDWFSTNLDLKRLLKICCTSSDCFQICCSVMNSLFIKTDFNMQIQRFICYFINCIKCEDTCFSELYPTRLQHIVLLLDIELNNLQGEIKTKYIECTLELLSNLHEECESDVIMLLSHFNKQWCNLYYVFKLNKN